MQTKVGLFDSFLKPVAGAQMENVQGSRYNYGQKQNNKPTHDPKPGSDAAAAHNMKDMILPSSAGTKLRVNLEQATMLPENVYKGLMGDPDANFFEHLQIAKIPYYVGGPVLAAVFAAGINKYDVATKKLAIQKTKQVAAGIAAYYAGAMLAKSVIDIPVKFFRGIDLNHPYRDIVDVRSGSPSGKFADKKKEFHKVFESVDFTRWDLLYDEEAKGHRGINKQFDKIAKKYGIDEKMNDSDSTLKDKIKETITMSRAWKYALTVPFVVTGIGLAHQEAFAKYGDNLVQEFKFELNKISKSKLSNVKSAAGVVYKKLVAPLGYGVKQLWNGKTKLQGAFGKTAILATVLGTIYANASILTKTSCKDKNIIDLEKYKK